MNRQPTFIFPNSRSQHLPNLGQHGWPSIRSDEAIEEELSVRLFKESGLGAGCREHLLAEVDHGQVKLSGHVQKRWQQALAGTIACHTQGVTGVSNELVVDEDLRAAVIQALVEDAQTSPYLFTVKCRNGWVSLGGLLPSVELVKAAEVTAGSVPTVRGIVSLPYILGMAGAPESPPEPPRRALQPRLTATVYVEPTGQRPYAAGLVAQVIIDPASRLVSHIVVRTSRNNGDAVDRLLPVSAIEAVSENSVWLAESETLEPFPAFESSRFPIAPQGWRPPFPYLVGTVRWIW